MPQDPHYRPMFCPGPWSDDPHDDLVIARFAPISFWWVQLLPYGIEWSAGRRLGGSLIWVRFFGLIPSVEPAGPWFIIYWLCFTLQFWDKKLYERELLDEIFPRE